MRATVCKRTTLWPVENFGHVASNSLQASTAFQTQLRTGRKQALCVRVCPCLKQVWCAGTFDHRAAVHHHDTVDLIAHQAQVVADEQQAHAIFGDQLTNQ